MKKIWTKEKCKEVALLCKYRNEFNSKYKSAYVTSSKNGWLSEICSHMEYNQTPPNSWTKERCKEVALMYNCRSDFQKNNYNVYRIAYDQKWLNEICNHMIKIGNIYKRLVYAFEFIDNSIYIGLTCDSNRRINEHLIGKTSVSKHIKETGLYPIYKELTDYIDSFEASEIEKYYVIYYRNNGFNILNKTEAGGLGGGKIKWNYKTCKEEASKYPNRTTFCKCKRKAYNRCIIEGWIDDFYPKK